MGKSFGAQKRKLSRWVRGKSAVSGGKGRLMDFKMHSTKAIAIFSDPRPEYLEVDGTSLLMQGKDHRKKQFSMSTVVETYERRAFLENLAHSTVLNQLNGESSTILVMGTQGTGKTRLSSYQAGILEALFAELATTVKPDHLITFSAFELFDDVVVDHFAPEDDFESTIADMRITKVQVIDMSQGLTLLEYVRNLSKNYTEMETSGVIEPAPSSSTMCFRLHLQNRATGVLSSINLVDPVPGENLNMLVTSLLDISSSGQTVEFFMSANPIPIAPITQFVLPILSYTKPIIIGLFNKSSESAQYAETLLSMLHLCRTSLETTKVLRNRMTPTFKPPRDMAEIIDPDLQRALNETIRSRSSVSSPLLSDTHNLQAATREDELGPDMGMKYENRDFHRHTKTSEPHYDGFYPSFNNTMCEQRTPPNTMKPRPTDYSSPASTSIRPEVDLLRNEDSTLHPLSPPDYGAQCIIEAPEHVYANSAHSQEYTMGTDAFPSALASSGIDNTANIISVKHNIVSLDPIVENNISPSVFNSLHAESPLVPSGAKFQDNKKPELPTGNLHFSPKAQSADSNNYRESTAILKSRFLDAFGHNSIMTMISSEQPSNQLDQKSEVELIESLSLQDIPQPSSQANLQGIKEKLTVATQALERATQYRDELLARVTDLECQGQEALLMSELHMMAAQKRANDIRQIISSSIGASLPAPGSGQTIQSQIPIPIADIKRLLNSHEEDIDNLERKLFAEIKGQAEAAISSALEYNKNAASRSLEDAQVKALVTELRKAVDMRLKNEVKLRQLQRQDRELCAKMLLFKEMERKHTLLKQERSGKANEVRQLKEKHKKLQHQNMNTQLQVDTLKKQLASATALLQDIKLDASSLRVAFQNLENALISNGPSAAVFPVYQANITSAPIENSTTGFMQKSAEAGSAFAMQVLHENQKPEGQVGDREDSLAGLNHLLSLVEDVLTATSKKAAASGLTIDERKVKEHIEDVKVCLTKAINARTAGSSANNCITDYTKYTVSLPLSISEAPSGCMNHPVTISGVVDTASKLIAGANKAFDESEKEQISKAYQTGYTMMSLDKMRVATPDMARSAELSMNAAVESARTAQFSYEPQNQSIGVQMKTPLTDTLQTVQSVERGIEERLRRLMNNYKETLS